MTSITKNREKRRIAIQGIDNLPTISVIFQKLLKLLESEDCSAKELSALISQDLSITSTILKLVNSAFYGYMREITSLHQAIVILGINTVKSIALGASLFKGSSKRGNRLEFDRNKLWFHSLGVASTSKAIAQKCGYKDIEEAFAAGLLHDLGKVVFDASFNKDFEKAMKLAKRESKSLLMAEKEVLDIGHDEAGYILLEKWKLPPTISNAVGYHHDPSKCDKDYRMLASIIHISDVIIKKINLGSSGDDVVPKISRSARTLLELTQAKLEEVVKEAAEKKEQIENFSLA